MSKPTYPQKPIIILVGPTASGKSDLAVYLARKFNGEIISADSRQVYKGMNIGTGKVSLSKSPHTQTLSYPAPLTQRGVRGVKPSGYYEGIAHYLLNVASPTRRFTAAQYKKLAQAAIKKIQNSHGRVSMARGSKPSERYSHANKIPIICGGTGFYIRMLVDNLDIPAVKPDLKLRAKLEKKTTEELFAELQKLDPRRAKAIDRHNPRRLVRALEIVLKTGRPVPTLNPPQLSFTKRGGVPPFRKGRLGGIYSPPLGGVRGDFTAPLRQRGATRLAEAIDVAQGGLKPLFLGIQIPRPKLARRIKSRLEKRLKHGMIAEVRKLRSQGLSWKRLDSFGLEYRWLAKYLQKTISYDEMVKRLQKDIEHYAKRQMTWFQRDPRIHWIKNERQATSIVKKFLK